MCVMCLIRSDQDFHPDYIETIYSRGNNDGFGLAYVEGDRYENGPKKGRLVRPGRIKSVKSMGGPIELKKIYEEHKGKNLIMHLRNATHGEKDLDNCHPYPILNIDEGDSIDLVMMHNGSIQNVQVDRKFSDSYNFATIHLRNLFRDRGPSILYEESFRYLVCSLIGANNKLMFLDNRERVTIINYEQGSIHPATVVWLSTKDNLQLPKAYVAPVPIHRPAQFGQGSATNQQNGESSEPKTTTGAKTVKMSWKQPDGSKWVMQNDGRSHYIPATITPDPETGQMLLLPGKKGDTKEIKALIEKSIASDKPEDLEALKKDLGKLGQIEIHQYVQEFPVESAYLMKYLANQTELLPEFKDSSVEDITLYCIESAWMAAHAVALATRFEQKVHEVS